MGLLGTVFYSAKQRVKVWILLILSWLQVPLAGGTAGFLGSATAIFSSGTFLGTSGTLNTIIMLILRM